MKKQEQEKVQLRRLTLSRETIRCLDEPKLEQAVAGLAAGAICPTDSLTVTRTGQQQEGGE
jgi:hypothetical protein